MLQQVPSLRLRFSLILMLTLLMSGCGFHLRGNYQIPSSLMTLHLSSSDEFSPLSKAVKMQLLRNNIKLVAPAEDIPNLVLGKEQVHNRTLSLYETGQVAEYEMSYLVELKLIRKNHLTKSFSIKFHRDYLDNPLAALAKSKERELIMSEFRVMASEQILRLLATVE